MKKLIFLLVVLILIGCAGGYLYYDLLKFNRSTKKQSDLVYIYSWVNENGVMSYSDRKPEGIDNFSVKEGFKYVLKSKYLRALALMVICYGLTMNLIEVTWKANLKLQYEFADGRIAPFIEMASRFVQAVRTRSEVCPSFAEGAKAQMLMDLAWQSHREGKWVKVPEAHI